MMLLSKTCFPGIIRGFMFISGTGSIPMIKQALVIWPDILSAHVERFASLRVSQEKMVYVPVEESTDGIAKVVYTSIDKKSRKTFNALDWLARLVTHTLN